MNGCKSSIKQLLVLYLLSNSYLLSNNLFWQKIKLEKFKTKHVNVKEFCEKIREGISDEHETVTVDDEKCSDPGGWRLPVPQNPDKTPKVSRSEGVKLFDNGNNPESKNQERKQKKSWNEAAKSTLLEDDPFPRLASRGGRKINIDIEPSSHRKISQVDKT